jgi:hypothetical protein
MEVFVRGTRTSARDRDRARHTPSSELPPLNDAQKSEAQRMGRSEEDLARAEYAGQLWQQRFLQRLLKFGRWLNRKVKGRNPDSRIESVELDTLMGKVSVTVFSGGEQFDFDMDEDLVERFLTTGSSEAEKSIDRLLDVFVPEQRVA